VRRVWRYDVLLIGWRDVTLVVWRDLRHVVRHDSRPIAGRPARFARAPRERDGQGRVVADARGGDRVEIAIGGVGRLQVG